MKEKKLHFIWKALASICLLYAVVMGFLGAVPRLQILNESIRNLYFHVPMWFSMMTMFFCSVFYAIKYLYKGNDLDDIKSESYINVGVVFGICGLVTGSLWAKFTWGQWWVIADPKLTNSAIVMLEYFAYLLLRRSITDEKSRAKVSAVYNIFAAATIIPLLFILPRMSDSLHPGNGGNPGFNSYDLDSNMRVVFYPAVLGWVLLSIWIASLQIRIKKLNTLIEDNYES